MKTILLLDTSGSMLEPVGHRQRIDVLNDILNRVLPAAPPDTRLFAFDSVVREIEHGAQLPAPGGSTALHRALQHIVPLRPAQVIIITDGMADRRDEALAAARALHCRIAAHYAGSEHDHDAVAFCYALAWCSADGVGQTAIHDLHHPERFVADLKLALTSPAR